MRKLGVVGMPGKMAQKVVALSRASGELQVVAQLAKPSNAAIGHDGVVAFDVSIFPHADVWLEFAHHSVTAQTIAACVAARKPLLVCTTGVGAETLQALRAAAQHIAVMFAPNTSLGVAALNAALRVALQALGPTYQVEIVELHHDKKKDAPSGTALRLVETVKAQRPAARVVTGRTDARGAEEIGVFGVRGGNVIGEHTVYLFGEDDRLELTHRAASRDLFAAGALRAAAWLAQQGPGEYTIENCLGLQ